MKSSIGRECRALQAGMGARGGLTSALAVALLVVAGCASPHAGARQANPQVEQALRPMCDVLDGAKTYRFRVSAVMDKPTQTGQLAQFHRTSEITVSRPDRLFVKTDGDEGDWSAWYNGKSLTVLARDGNGYATEAVPGRLDHMLDYIAERHHLVMPMADLIVGETYRSLLANVQSGTYLGLHNVDDTPCHHLLMRQENIDWQIWIVAGKSPVPRKIVITYKQQPGQPQYVATMDDWNLSPAISQETFKFTPPAGAKVASMAELVGQERGEQP